MQIQNGHPIIEASDSPLTVDNALRDSVRYWNDSMPIDQAFAWRHRANDSWELVEDGFGIIGDRVLRPDGKAQIYLSPDELELAIVAYGCRIIDEDPTRSPELSAVDALLKQIDRIKAA